MSLTRVGHVGLVTGSLASLACPGVGGTGWSSPSIEGTILDRGKPPVGEVSIAVVDKKDGRSASFTVAGPDGTFTAEVPPGDYALAITSSGGFSFIEQAHVPGRLSTIELDQACTRVRGRIGGTVELPAVAHLTRYSRLTGDTFVMRLTKDGSFDACLPAARYAVWVDGETLTQPLAVDVSGAEQALSIHGWPRAELEVAAPAVPQLTSDLGSFVGWLANGPRMIGMGEANHGTGDFYRRRGELSLALAGAGDLRYILLEADATAMLAIDDYVQGVAVELASAITKIQFWITDTEDMLELARTLRAYNAGVSAERRVHFLGIDSQFADVPSSWLIANGQALGITEAERAILSRVADDAGVASTLSAGDLAVIGALVDRLQTAPPRGNLADIRTRAAIVARSLGHDLSYIGLPPGTGRRDAAMADIAALTVDLGGPGQAAVWGHNGHIATEPDSALESLGHHLRRRYPDYVPIAFLSYDGTARAWDPAGEIGVIPRELGPAPVYSVEAAVMAATSAEIAWVRMDQLPRPLAGWLERPRFVREFGSAFRSQPLALRDFPGSFSAVVVIRHASASRPTPTGVRKAP